MTTATTIQQYYNAFYGRPADPSGLRFWTRGVDQTGDLIGSAIRAFGDPNTPEFSLRFPAGTSTSTFLDTAYKNMFNRTPDADGKAFWNAAFDNWVGGGKSEGEARALILQNFIDAANGQVGTNDKLTITNKLLVADSMTDSVRAYGTEASYLTGLEKAQSLLADVDNTQSSVNTALARIKFGHVDGINPSTGTNAPPISIINAGAAQGTLSLDHATKHIIKFSSSKDAPFTYKILSDQTTAPGPLVITSFNLAQDKLDFSALNLDSRAQESNISYRTQPWAGTDWVSWATGTNPDGSPIGYKAYTDFFNGKSFAVWDFAPGASYNNTYLFVDLNNNNNLDPETDLWLHFSGIGASDVVDALFII